MSTNSHQIMVGGLSIEVVRKDIKNLHLGVYPPHGRVRVAVPMIMKDEAVRVAIARKLGWIKKQKAKFENQPRQSPREYVSGESHYFLGQRYRLRVLKQAGFEGVTLNGKFSIELFVHPDADTAHKEHLMHKWYRAELNAMIPDLLDVWQRRLKVEVKEWGVRKMKTKWGSCNTQAHRVWFNLELAKKPPQCLEYIVAHELTHLIERKHNERFVAVMEKHIPHWRNVRDELNASVLGGLVNGSRLL
ncbi:MAG: M48 family metallopeptidase [bacterium]|nr:M48 family metallopeptidase [bacterium]